MRLAWLDAKDPAAGVDHERLWPPVFAAAGLVGWIVLRSPLALTLPCPFRALTGIACPTCGATRACRALLALDPLAALASNPLLTLAILLVALWTPFALVSAAASTRRLRLRDVGRRDRVLAALAVAANWLYLIGAGR